MLEVEYLKKIGIILDTVCLLVLAIVTSSLINEKFKRFTKLRKIYCLNIALNMIIVILDIVSWKLYRALDNINLYRFITYSEFILLCIYEGFNYYLFSIYFSSEKNKSHHIVYVAFAICSILLMIKGVSSKILYLQDGDWKQGVLFVPFISVFMLVNLGIIYWTIKKRKILGLGNTIAISFGLIIQIIQGITTTKEEVTHALIAITMSNLLFYLINYQNKRAELRRAENEISQLENKILLSQIKPHFMFNTLSSISSLCSKDPLKAREGIDAFSQYLRDNLEIIDKETIPFDKELDAIENYVFIQQMRFVDKINVIYDIKVDSFEVVPLTVLTLVENAVKHGLCQKENGGTIKLSTYEDNDNYYIDIVDDGVGFDAKSLENIGSEHVGIRNSKLRIERELKGSLSIESSVGKGTSVSIIIPKVSK